MPNQIPLSSKLTCNPIVGVYPLSLRRPLLVENRKWVKILVLNIVGLLVLVIYFSWVGFISARRNELPQLLFAPRSAYFVALIIWLSISVYIFNASMSLPAIRFLLYSLASFEEQRRALPARVSQSLSALR